MSPNVPKTSDARRKGRDQSPAIEQLARAVALCHEDRLTDGQSAHRLGIARRTLARWKNDERWPLLWLGASAYSSLLIERQTEAWAAARAEAFAERIAARG